MLGLGPKVSIHAAVSIGNIINKKTADEQVAQTFESFVTSKVSPAMAVGGHQSILYLNHLKAMLGVLSKSKLE